MAERVAEERTERIGRTVGYQIRMESKMSQQTRLLFCTTGILLRRMEADRLLEGRYGGMNLTLPRHPVAIRGHLISGSLALPCYFLLFQETYKKGSG